MRRFRHAIGRLFHSRAGGTLACVLLASAVGGVALANPGAFGGGGPGRAAVEASTASSDAQGGNARWAGTVQGGGTDSAAGCRLLVAHLADELDAGDATRLERAIGVVVRRCGRHEAAGGLANALDRLARNLERKLEKEAARAERRAERAGNGPGSVRQDDDNRSSGAGAVKDGSQGDVKDGGPSDGTGSGDRGLQGDQPPAGGKGSVSEEAGGKGPGGQPPGGDPQAAADPNDGDTAS